MCILWTQIWSSLLYCNDRSLVIVFPVRIVQLRDTESNRTGNWINRIRTVTTQQKVQSRRHWIKPDQELNQPDQDSHHTDLQEEEEGRRRAERKNLGGGGRTEKSRRERREEEPGTTTTTQTTQTTQQQAYTIINYVYSLFHPLFHYQRGEEELGRKGKEEVHRLSWRISVHRGEK